MKIMRIQEKFYPTVVKLKRLYVVAHYDGMFENQDIHDHASTADDSSNHRHYLLTFMRLRFVMKIPSAESSTKLHALQA